MTETEAPDPVTVILADDHTLFREGVQAILATDDIQVVATTDNGAEVPNLVDQHRPRVAILDVQMPGPGPVELLRLIRATHPATCVIFLSMHQPPSLPSLLEEHGAAAYLRKTVDRTILNATIKAVALGMSVRTPSSPEGDVNNLSEHELKMINLAARSMSNRDIAELLFISESTVKRNFTGIYKKFGVNSRAEALAHAAQHGLIAPGE